MRVLVACEFSGTVRDAFIARGHDAWSCDILPTEKEGPHIQDDVLKHLDDGWDLMIAHPPCTYLTCAGNKWFKPEYATRFPNRPQQRASAIAFFLALAKCGVKRYAIENPIGIMSTTWRRPDQVIQPYMFGHEARKSTCLWLRGLPKLLPTLVVAQGAISKSGVPCWYNDCLRLAPQERMLARSKTFPRVAKAMAEQWG